MRLSTTQSASSGGPYLKPNDETVQRKPGGLRVRGTTVSTMRWDSSASLSAPVSMTMSAAARRAVSAARSALTAAWPDPAAAQGWGRLLSARRRTSTASGASRKTTRAPATPRAMRARHRGERRRRRPPGVRSRLRDEGREQWDGKVVDAADPRRLEGAERSRLARSAHPGEHPRPRSRLGGVVVTATKCSEGTAFAPARPAPCHEIARCLTILRGG